MASYSIIDLSNGSFKTYDDGIAPEGKIFWVPYTDAPELDKWDRFKLKIKALKDSDYYIMITLGFANGAGNTKFGNLQDTITIYGWDSKDKTDFAEGRMCGVEVEYDDADEAYILDLTDAYDDFKGYHYTDGLYVNEKGIMGPGIQVSDGLACELVYLAYTEAPTTIPECTPDEL